MKAGEKSLAKAPRAGIMIGIPVGFARSIVDQVVTGLFRETTLTLKNLRVHKEGDVKTKMVFRKKQVGQFVLDVLVHEAKGVLRPGKPRLDFGDNRIKVALPVALAGGEGTRAAGLQVGQQGAGRERGLRRRRHHPGGHRQGGAGGLSRGGGVWNVHRRQRHHPPARLRGVGGADLRHPHRAGVAGSGRGGGGAAGGLPRGPREDRHQEDPGASSWTRAST